MRSTEKSDHLNPLEVVFIGHLTPMGEFGAGSSVAGNQVQMQILQELTIQSKPGRVDCFAMQAMPAWPRGPLFARSIVEPSVNFIGFVNLMILKHIVFALRVFLLLRQTRPKLTLQYNSYLFENFSLMAYRATQRKSVSALIIQDVHVDPEICFLSKRGWRALSERLSLFVARKFDFIVPISWSIISDFNFSPEKCMVFQGGATDFALSLIGDADEKLSDFAVFAGALEPHNGVDKLINRWLENDIDAVLHIFGRGSLTELAKDAARGSRRVVFHGFVAEELIQQWQRKAQWNFCLRYSLGLNQEYFFPSKLFNVLCAPGAVLINKIHGVPDEIYRHVHLVNDDLSNLGAVLTLAKESASVSCITARRQVVLSSHSWSSCIKRVIVAQRSNK